VPTLRVGRAMALLPLVPSWHVIWRPLHLRLCFLQQLSWLYKHKYSIMKAMSPLSNQWQEELCTYCVSPLTFDALEELSGQAKLG